MWSENITRQDFANTEIAAEINMITEHAKKVIVIEVNAQRDTLKNAKDSKAVWDVGLKKDVLTNTRRKTTQQNNLKLTYLWQVFQ